MNPDVPLTRYAWLSIATAVITILLKGSAYLLTGSVGLLSNALESTVNLAAAVVALFALRRASRPADDGFTFGYSKVEYFASGFEGGMILLAAAVITLVWLTGLIRLDPILALLVAVNILFTGYRLLVRSGRGLMDISIPAEELDSIKSILNSYASQGVSYHALRSRRAAARNFMVVHLLVPGDWTITAGHKLADEIENRVRSAIPNTNIVTHIEPAGDPLSIQDASLDRSAAGY